MINPADLGALEAQLERELCTSSLADFTRLAWPLLEPNGRPYVPNTASDAIIEHLQAVGEGKLRRLVVAVPPGSGKSTLCSIAFLPWLWLRRPAARGIHASHAHDLALALSRRARRLVESPWYRRLSGLELRDDQNRAEFWENTRSGRRQATGVGGSLTGHRGDLAVIDDALNSVDRHSKATREGVNDWFDSALMNRLDDPDNAPVVVIQQRLHSNDLIGHLLGQGGWEALILAAEFDPARRTVTSIWQDPRTEQGQLLAPEIHSAAALAEQRRVLGSGGYGCIFQQNPTDEEGGLFRREWWRFWKPDGTAAPAGKRPDGCTDTPAVPLPRDLGLVTISIDCAFKDGSKNDYVVAVVVAARGADRFVLDLRRGRMDFTRTCAMVRELAIRYRGARILIEDAANGPAVVSAMRRQVSGLVPIRPEGGKESRAAACSPQVESGNVYLPDGAGWLPAFIEELGAFPRGKHDDQVDALTQALNNVSGLPRPVYRGARHAYWMPFG